MRRILAIMAITFALGQNAQAEIVGHPDGCPRRLFCGCGAALKVFNEHRRDLWSASSWYRFPRSEPASGMVGVTRRHVFVLQQHVQGNIWIVYDANSGGGKTRIHQRSIAGYTIVNPHGGSRMANAKGDLSSGLSQYSSF